MSENTPMLFQFFTEIGIIDQLATAKLEAKLPMAIKSSQFGVLNHLMRTGDGVTHSQLTQSFQVTKGAMTNNLNRLLEKGLIKIEPDKTDGRSKRVYLTESGITVRNQAVMSLSEEFELLLNHFSAEEFKSAIPFLESLRSFLDQNR